MKICARAGLHQRAQQVQRNGRMVACYQDGLSRGEFGPAGQFCLFHIAPGASFAPNCLNFKLSNATAATVSWLGACP